MLIMAIEACQALAIRSLGATGMGSSISWQDPIKLLAKSFSDTSILELLL